MKPGRRAGIAGASVFALFLLVVSGLLAGVARAGSYLDRAQFLVAQTNSGREFLRAHLRNRELAELVRREAEGRLLGAKATLVPKQVVMAHPHLLLMLENFERAALAVALGDLKRYYRTQKLADDEAQLFKSILLQLGWQLPSKKRARSGP